MKNCCLLLISFCCLLQAADIAIVIDDCGYSGYPSRKLFLSEHQLTLAILPFAPQATDIALKARKAGFETILHLPLQPHEQIRMNSAYLRVEMSPREIDQVIVSDMLKLPGIAGVNNHQGSMFTEDFAQMTVLLKTLSRYNLFFLDSLTSPRSTTKKISEATGMTILRRDVFLDNLSSEEYIGQQLNQLFGIAVKNGSAIGIGHARTATVESLEKLLPEMLSKYHDTRIVPLSHIYNLHRNDAGTP